MRCVDDDGFGICPHQMTEFIQVECPAVFCACLPGTHVTACGAGNLRQGLVSGRMDNDVVIFLENGGHEEEDRLLCTGMDENLFRLDCFVQFSNLRAQCGATLSFCI